MKRLVSHIVLLSVLGYMLVENFGNRRMWVIAVVAAVWAFAAAADIYRNRGSIRTFLSKRPSFSFAKIRIGFTSKEAPVSDSLQDKIAVYASYALYAVLAVLSLLGILQYFNQDALPGMVLEKWLVPVLIALAVLSVFRKRYRYIAWVKKRMER